MKDSIVKAEQEALRLSLANPNITYYVMDKKRKQAVCSASEWVVRERILDGWYGVCRYKNGVRKI